MSPRYAVYLAPDPATPLWRFGSAVIGYDAASGAEPAAPDLPGFDRESWRDITAEPRRYGFHGTLKAPFRLAAGRGEGDLLAALGALAAAHHPFEMPPLEVRELGHFIALVPPAPVPALLDLAGAAVVELDGLRAPLSAAEIERRRPDRLSARQREYLDRYGYPYVLEEFRYHMTLTGSLQEPAFGHAANALRDAYGASPAHGPLPVADLALYRQDGPAGRFRIVHRAALGREARA